MKVLPFNIPKPENMAIIYERDVAPLYDQLHQHEEVQISWIEKGEGTLFAGDTIHRYQSGDIIVFGSRQAHVFRWSSETTVMHTVFFSLSTFGELFINLEEGKGIAAFYAFAKAGLKTTVTKEIEKLFKQISKSKGMSRLSYFLRLITDIRALKTKRLSNFVYDRTISEQDGKRMNTIFTYTLENFSTKISLDTIATVANMTPNAFCKYFKQRTDKTYFEVVNELRIDKASNLLLGQPELPVNVVADICGFQTLSHFNKKFKAFKKMTPRQYRKETLAQ